MTDEMIIKTAEGNLVDEVYSSPVDEWQHRARGLVLLIAVIVIAADRHLFRLVFRPGSHAAITPISRSISNTDPLEASRADRFSIP